MTSEHVNPYREAYEAFTASLDPQTSDALNKLMLHTRTRPDDPQMVGVCLTLIVTAKSAELQAQVLETQQKTARELEAMKTDPSFVQGLERVSELKSSLAAIERTLGYSLSLLGLWAAVIGLVWALTLVFAWQKGYSVGHDSVRAANHQALCDDLNGYISSTSAYWRKLGYSAAADKIGQTYSIHCPR